MIANVYLFISSNKLFRTISLLFYLYNLLLEDLIKADKQLIK